MEGDRDTEAWNVWLDDIDSRAEYGRIRTIEALMEKGNSKKEQLELEWSRKIKDLVS